MVIYGLLIILILVVIATFIIDLYYCKMLSDNYLLLYELSKKSENDEPL